MSRQLGDEPPVVWKKEQVSFPLESDEAVIEFLAKHDYDLNKAKFYLACILSGGRGKNPFTEGHYIYVEVHL